MESLIALGYPGLFIACFLAATVVPFSSDIVFAAMVYGPFDPMICLVVASLGNWGGGMTTFGLGWLGRAEKVERVLKIDPQKVAKADPYIKRWGIALALFCWLPFIGDVFAAALGFARTRIVPVSILMLIGKTARYVVVYYLVYAIK